jgi:uncharacterized membrane protein
VVGDSAAGVGFVWRQDTGFHVLQSPPAAVGWGADAVNTDGSVIAGIYFPATGAGLVRWTNGVPQILGPSMTAVAVSDDGTVIPGNDGLIPEVWSEQYGLRGVADYFGLQGAILPPGLTLYQLSTMTPDGRTFVGRGILNGVDGLRGDRSSADLLGLVPHSHDNRAPAATARGRDSVQLNPPWAVTS